MVVEHDVIDLDALPTGHDGRAAGRARARRRTALRFAAVFTAGLVVGGVAVTVLRDQLDRQERDATVRLVASTETANLGGSGTAGHVQLNGMLVVLNHGPAPLTIRGAQAARPDVTVRSYGQPQVVPPAGTVRISVQLGFDCPVVINPEPVPIVFSVETADGQAREHRHGVPLVGSVWTTDAMGMCAQSPPT
ncbi:hypothetical protein [Catellatospora sp. NPDC049609]|uniref:hypothetical protein n=1 Tax=Catellatospora sp. NPDC049609 TaxID=3155505 RepID=UPI00341BC705